MRKRENSDGDCRQRTGPIYSIAYLSTKPVLSAAVADARGELL